MYHLNMLKKYIAREPEVEVVHTSNKDNVTIAAAGVIHQDTDPELGEVPDLEGYHQKERVRGVKLREDLSEDQRHMLKDLTRKYPYFNSIIVNSRSELHDYNTRNKDRIHINPTSHKYAENCIRNQIPIILNEMPSIVLQEVYTHSYKGFVNYAKNFILQLYQTECQIDNCFVCNNSGY